MADFALSLPAHYRSRRTVSGSLHEGCIDCGLVIAELSGAFTGLLIEEGHKDKGGVSSASPLQQAHAAMLTRLLSAPVKPT